MKNLILTLITISMVNTISGQDNANITGVYSLGATSPEGGSHLLVFEDGKYAIMYFGGMQAGQWEHTQGNVYKFTPDSKEGLFELYGRHDKNLKNKTRISFNSFENGETFIHTGAVKEDTYVMKRVFNSGANGFSYPYVHTFKTNGDIISFMYKDYDYDQDHMITFKNPNGYNDFVVSFAGQEHERESQPFLTTFKENKLYFEEDDYATQKPFDEDDEEIEEIRKLASQVINREALHFNPSYLLFEGDINENHVFNEEKGAYIDEEYYQEGEEHIKSEQSYDSMTVIYSFELLKDYSAEIVKYKIDDDSIFKVGED